MSTLRSSPSALQYSTGSTSPSITAINTFLPATRLISPESTILMIVANFSAVIVRSANVFPSLRKTPAQSERIQLAVSLALQPKATVSSKSLLILLLEISISISLSEIPAAL